MRKALILFLIPVYMLLVTNFSCNTPAADADGPLVRVYFWKNTGVGATHHLYIEDSSSGVLPYLPDSLQQQPNDAALTHYLKPGKYKVRAMDNEQHVLCEGTLRIKIGDGTSREVNTRWNNNNCGALVVLDK